MPDSKDLQRFQQETRTQKEATWQAKQQRLIERHQYQGGNQK